MKPWFCPQPWSVSHVEIDVRPGGSNLIVMNGPNGEVVPNRGVYLEVAPNEKLVFTDAFTSAWVPSEKPFMVAELTFADEGGKTRYRAVARHWSEEDMKSHQAMGFEEAGASSPRSSKPSPGRSEEPRHELNMAASQRRRDLYISPNLYRDGEFLQRPRFRWGTNQYELGGR